MNVGSIYEIRSESKTLGSTKLHDTCDLDFFLEL